MATNYTMSVDLDGSLVTCTDGHVAGGTEEQQVRMKAAAYTSEAVQIVVPFGQFVRASFGEDDPVGNLAAIVAASMRWKIIEAPDEVLRFLDTQVELAEPDPDGADLELVLGAEED